jgi:type VI secretion system protein ImpC
MADRSRAGIDMNFTFGKGKKTSLPDSSEAPFRMLVFGDFGGHASRGENRGLANLRPLRVDLDSFNSVFAKAAPTVEIRLGDQPPCAFAFKDLEDFHPDHLFQGSGFFAPMRELRRQLCDPKTFAMAAAMVQRVELPEAKAPEAQVAAHADDLQRLLGRAPSAPAAPTPTSIAPTPNSIVDGLMREAVAPHITGKADPRQAELVASVDGMTSELMGAVLHDAGFQQVESLWRALDGLVRNLELDENLQIFLLDVSREELARDFGAATSPTESAMYRLVVDQVGDKPWSLLVDGTRYGRSKDDAALLARLGALAQSRGAALVAGMDFAAWKEGFRSAEDRDAWTALRNSPAATSIAVAAPSILVRLPYGKDTDATERFVFTEQSNPPTSQRYLWGSAAFSVAQLIAQSYASAGGWDFTPGDECVLGDLPVHITKQEGESVQTPCAQVWLPESAIDALIKDGLVPMVSSRGRGEVRMPRLQSLASPPAALTGPWQSA